MTAISASPYNASFGLIGKHLAMKSLFYVEEDFVAGLLKDYFVAGGGDTAHFVRGGSNGLQDRLSRETIDLFLAQSEDPEKLARILNSSGGNNAKSPL